MKKDPNYIAAVEKAITEKYGKDTVQDFRSDWNEAKEQEYLKQIKEKKRKLKRQKKIDKTSRTCPVCKTYSFSSKDDLYMNRFQCCYDCHVKYMPNPHFEKKWLNGWRPESISAEDNS